MDDIYGYDSPIMMAVKQHCDKIIEERENEMVMRIEEEIGLHIDKNELIKALQYDRDQYSAGYRNGYKAAEEKYEAKLAEIRNLLGIVSPSKQFEVDPDELKEALQKGINGTYNN